MPDELPEWLIGDSPYLGNGTAFGDLREALLARRQSRAPRVICFAGAGCSMPLLPGWADLLNGMRNDAKSYFRFPGQRQEIDHLPDPAGLSGGYLELAAKLKQLAGAREFYQFLARHLTVPGNQPRFTRTHAIIACLDVDGLVTTNFDACLTAAQTRRYQLDPRLDGVTLDRPCSAGLGGDAGDHLKAWLKRGREFSFGGDTNAPLYLHGSLDAVKDVVFTEDDYDRFYEGDNPGAFFFEQLSGITTLLFVGYSFTDPFIDHVLARVAERPVWQGDHFALIGVETTDDLDQRVERLRALRVEPIFYPITTPDHPNLHIVLDALGVHDPALVRHMCAPGGRADAPPAERAPLSIPGGLRVPTVEVPVVPVPPASAEEWDKLPGLDASQLVLRRTDLAQLTHYARDPAVRVIGVVGLGGTGKTTLVRQVFESPALATARFPDGVLVHPIRDDAQVDSIIDTLCDTYPPAAPIDPRDRAARLEHGRQILSAKRLLLVLDGLELLQGRPAQPEYGRFLSDDLRILLLGLARSGAALVVITSRFPLIEFQDYLGASCRTIELSGLTDGESIALLRQAGVKGDDSVLSAARDAFDGHPLGLALLGGALVGGLSAPLFAGGDLGRALSVLRSSSGATLDAQLKSLLDWYFKVLSPAQLAMLTQLAVYPTSVSQKELETLLGKGRIRAGGQPLTVDEGELALRALRQTRLIQFDLGRSRYECHAIIRQILRRRDDAAARVAIQSLTGDAAAVGPVETVEELQRVVETIEIAIESLADFREANTRLIQKLKSGESFLDLGVPHIGVACLGRLVFDDPWSNDKTRRIAAEEAIGKRSIGAYVSWMREFHEDLGNLDEADRWRLVDGERYIDWGADPPAAGAYRFWRDGLRYKTAQGDASACHALRAGAWEKYGGRIRRGLEDGSILQDDGLALLTIDFASGMEFQHQDGWSRIRPDVMRHALRFKSWAVVAWALACVYGHLHASLEGRFQTRAGTEFVRLISSTLLEETASQAERLKTALYRIEFLAAAREARRPLSGQILADLALHCFERRWRWDAERGTKQVQALLTAANAFERERRYSGSAQARSWAAERLTYTGQASTAIEWTNRALDVCGEDRQERARAVHMRGCAHLALGDGVAALADAELSLGISLAGGWTGYIAYNLALRSLAARESGDPRAETWEHERRLFCGQVYGTAYYESFPRIPLLPGDSGFHVAFPNLDWPDQLLQAIPSQDEVLEALAAGGIEDLVERYRRDVLGPWTSANRKSDSTKA